MATQIGIQQVAAVLPASDLDRARRFYEETLGFTLQLEADAGLFFSGGSGSLFFVYKSQGPASGLHTQVGLLVDDLDATMEELSSRGVTFEDYDIPTAHTDHEVMTLDEGRGAFFKDSEGNILAINEVDPSMRSALGL
jgi:predicted enzyme related to lactoylglutathione lyase